MIKHMNEDVLVKEPIYRLIDNVRDKGTLVLSGTGKTTALEIAEKEMTHGNKSAIYVDFNEYGKLPFSILDMDGVKLLNTFFEIKMALKIKNYLLTYFLDHEDLVEFESMFDDIDDRNKDFETYTQYHIASDEFSAHTWAVKEPRYLNFGEITHKLLQKMALFLKLNNIVILVDNFDSFNFDQDIYQEYLYKYMSLFDSTVLAFENADSFQARNKYCLTFTENELIDLVNQKIKSHNQQYGVQTAFFDTLVSRETVKTVFEKCNFNLKTFLKVVDDFYSLYWNMDEYGFINYSREDFFVHLAVAESNLNKASQSLTLVHKDVE